MMSNIIVGFTGTQNGMNIFQKCKVDDLLHMMQATGYKITEVHHGDCIGADKDFDTISKQYGIKIVLHPPIIGTKRAYCNKDDYSDRNILPVKDYLVRNQDIVNASDVMIATPKENDEQLRSGTWATIRRFKKTGRILIIVFPEKIEFHGKAANG